MNYGFLACLRQLSWVFCSRRNQAGRQFCTILETSITNLRNLRHSTQIENWLFGSGTMLGVFHYKRGGGLLMSASFYKSYNGHWDNWRNQNEKRFSVRFNRRKKTEKCRQQYWLAVCFSFCMLSGAYYKRFNENCEKYLSLQQLFYHPSVHK